MSAKQAKQIRKQAMSEVGREMNLRLDSIQDTVNRELKIQNDRAKNVQSFIINQVTGKIQNDLFNANCTIDAVVAVLAEAGLNIPDFASKVDVKKLEISKQKIAEASKAMEQDNIAKSAQATQEAAQTQTLEAVNPVV